MGKFSLHVHPGENSTRTPTYITEMWSAEAHQDSNTGSPTNFCTLDRVLLYPGRPTAWGSPLSAVTQSTQLNFWAHFIHLQEQSLRRDTSSSPWSQRQQHEDNLLGSWSTCSFSLHTHTPSPISSLLTTKSRPVWWCLISEGLNKLI